MPIALEQIPLAPGQCFRLVRWQDNVREIDLCLPRNHARRLNGSGEQWHFHPEVELALITRGKGHRFVGDHVAAFEAPELVLLGSNLPHYWSGLTGSRGYALQFVAEADHPLWQIAETASLRTVHERSARGALLTGSIVTEVEGYMRRMAAGDDPQRLADFLSILATIASARPEQLTALSDTRFTLHHHDPYVQTISDAVAYILRHIHDEIVLDDLLAVTRMSKPTFCRQFKRHTGRTLIAFVNQVRVAFAKQRLGKTNRSITEIAFESGYTNLSHFNRQFRRICGCSPREYRRRLHG